MPRPRARIAGQQPLAQPRGREQVHLEHLAPRVGRRRLERADRPQHTGVVDERVDAPAALGEPLHLRGLRQVGRERVRMAARGGDFPGGRRERPGSRAESRSRAPCRASSSAISRPRPRDAPVTSTTLPASAAHERSSTQPLACR